MDIRKFLSKKPRLEAPNDSAVVPSASCSKIQVNVSAPDDLTQKGDEIKHIYLKEYPKQGNNRSFRPSWYKRFKWLEYSVKRDAAFCYACIQFQPYGSKETAYTETGFRNWKNALDAKSGFPKHENSATHIRAMALWAEKYHRINTCKSVSTLINEDALEKNRYYVKSIAEVVQFLAVNELALRGDYCVEEKAERGLFIRLFEYTLKKDKFLEECYKHVPKNAKYVSPEIQNQIIEVMANIVRESVAQDIKNSDVPWFTILEDGTRDKNNRENIAIAIRYVKDGQVKESLLGIITTQRQDAKTLTELTFKTLKDNDLDVNRLLSQCYDGASVMSGKVGGVSARVSKKLNREVPYVHCYNHRLHLVVTKTVSEITAIRHFFDQCIMLHEFFQHAKVASLYNGKTIGRLLEQRWSGHFAICRAIMSSYDEIIRTLDTIKKQEFSQFSGQDIAKSVGMKHVMLKLEFRFALVLIMKILGLLEPGDTALQGRRTSLKDANDIIAIIKKQVSDMRTEEKFASVLKDAKEILSSDFVPDETEKRQKRKVISLSDYIVSEKLPSETQDTSMAVKEVYYETIDAVIMQIDERFTKNKELIQAICSIEEFEAEKLHYFDDLGVATPSKEEFAVAKQFILERQTTENTFDLLYKQREVFSRTYELFATVATFGCSTAVCESSFSTLTAINRPQRLSMSHQRMADLVYLAFEKTRTEQLDFNKFLEKFNGIKDRKLQLY